jgi:hypothetical protein
MPKGGTFMTHEDASRLRDNCRKYLGKCSNGIDIAIRKHRYDMKAAAAEVFGEFGETAGCVLSRHILKYEAAWNWNCDCFSNSNLDWACRVAGGHENHDKFGLYRDAWLSANPRKINRFAEEYRKLLES